MSDPGRLERDLIQYCQLALREGRWAQLEALGVGVETLRLIRELPLGEVEFDRGGSLIHRLEIDQQALRRHLNQARQRARQEALVDELVRAGGTWSLLHHFFGLTRTEFAGRRHLLGVSRRGGWRPRRKVAPRARQRQVAEAVRNFLAEQTAKRSACAQARALLEARGQLGFPLMEVWSLLNQARRHGLFRWP